MFLSRFLFGAVLIGTSLADLNYTAVLELPTCSVKCSASIVEASGCGINNLTTCLCTNAKLQYDLGLCVLASCNTTEQLLASSITRKYICNGPIESKSEEVFRNSIIIAAVTFPIILLRFISRLVIGNRLWWDDWSILVAAVLMVPNTFSPIYTSFYGFGKHFYNIDPANLPLLLKWFYASSIIYVIIQNLPKISILFLYLRIFPTTSFVRIVKLVLAFVILQCTIFTLLVVFQCTPIDSIWDLTKKKKCINGGNLMTLVGAGFSIGQDVVIMLLPVIELRKLKMSLRKKIEIALLFAVGSFGCITAMIRLKFIVKYFYTSYDFSWDTVDVVLWSDIETYSAAICACLITIRPLVIKLFPSIFPSSKASYPNKYKSGSKRSEKKEGLINTFHKIKEDSERESGGGEKFSTKSFGTDTTATMGSFHLDGRDEEEGVKENAYEVNGFKFPFHKSQTAINGRASVHSHQELRNDEIKITVESRVSFHEGQSLNHNHDSTSKEELEMPQPTMHRVRLSQEEVELHNLNRQRVKGLRSLDLGDSRESRIEEMEGRSRSMTKSPGRGLETRWYES